MDWGQATRLKALQSNPGASPGTLGDDSEVYVNTVNVCSVLGV